MDDQNLPEPTEAFPGTREKIEVLRRRRIRGEQLHHEEDTKLDYRLPNAPPLSEVPIGRPMSPFDWG